jgi:hypothetical protein
VCGQHHAPAAFIPWKDPAPIVQEAGWAPEPVWIGAENLAPPGFDQLYEASFFIQNRASKRWVLKCVKQISMGAAFELQLLFVVCEKQKENRNRTNDSKWL